MIKEEIAAGIKNAIERGDSLEKAKQSFINAGYNPQEVEQAAASIGGVLKNYSPPAQSIPHLNTKGQKQIPATSSLQAPAPQQTQSSQTKPLPTQTQVKKPKKPIIVFLIIILAILLFFLLISLLFKEKILDFIKSIL